MEIMGIEYWKTDKIKFCYLNSLVEIIKLLIQHMNWFIEQSIFHYAFKFSALISFQKL